jgi:protoporphyrinogen oxidase
MKKNIVIIGAGPAGLSAGYEILKEADKYNVVILEKSSAIGGISRTVCHNGNRMDIGGHRFFSKDENIVKWWLEMLPMQNKQTIDFSQFL